MNTLHITPENWEEYLQTYTPENEQQAAEYAKDLQAYATDNAGCIMVEAVLRRPELQGFALLDKLYARVKHDLAAHQQAIGEGFFHQQ